MILYIHGFASCGLSNKSRVLMQHYGTDQVLAPDLNHAPAAAIQQLETLLAEHPVELLVGSSMGGFYATWLNRHNTPTPAVLVNPAVSPPKLLNDLIGEHEGCQGKFDFTPEHIQQLKAMRRDTLRVQEHYLVLLQTEDEVLDYRHAAAFYADKNVVVETGGNHRFENLNDYLPQIDHWRANLKSHG